MTKKVNIALITFELKAQRKKEGILDDELREKVNQLKTGLINTN